jgi:hypothetical protein
MYQPIQLTSTIPSIRNSRSRSPLWRRVLLVTVPAAALVALAVALQQVAQADTTSTPTPTPTPPKFKLLRTVPLQTNAWGSVTVNERLNKIYTSGNPSSNFDVEVTVIDGVTFATTDVGYGSEASVDNKTNRYWAATIYQGNVIVRDGTTDTVVATVPIPGGVCPIQTNYDFHKNRVWASAQCGNLHDPIFAIDARTYAITAGPIDSGGVMGPIIANGANGRLYFTEQYQGFGPQISKMVNPKTFAVTNNAFGTVRAINALTNKLYAVPDGTNNLQIINGAPDPEVILANIPLGYSPGSLGINTALNHLYITNPAGSSIEVRNGSTGALITTFNLPTGRRPSGAMAVDSTRGRIYVIHYPSGNSGLALLVIEDLINAFEPYCVLSH